MANTPNLPTTTFSITGLGLEESAQATYTCTFTATGGATAVGQLIVIFARYQQEF
jgi:hypothetical protein